MAISDLHIPYGNSNKVFVKALQDAKNNQCSAICIAGDVTDRGYDSEYDEFMSLMKENTDIPVYCVLGNHDVRWLKGGFEEAKNRFLDKTKMPGIYYDEWINGYHFIFLTSETDAKDMSYISDTQMNWLSDKLTEKSRIDKPIFLFLHAPLEYTVSFSFPGNLPNSYTSDDVQDQKLKDILGQCPQSILITGHCHDDLCFGGTLYNEKYCTMIRDGAIIEARQGLIFDIYEDKVEIRIRDFSCEAATTVRRLNIRNFDSAYREVPTAPINLRATATTDTTINLEWDASSNNFTGNVGITGYDIYSGENLAGSTTGRTNYQVTGLTPGTEYQFTVKAKDAAGNLSDTSDALSIRTDKEAPPITNIALNKPVTASPSVSGCEPAKAVDGKSEVENKWSSDVPGDKWLMVDLEQYYDISRWVVKHAGSGGETLSLNTKDFCLQKTEDGVNWTTIDLVTGNLSSITDRNIPKFTARYVRLYITTPKNFADTGETNIYGFELYGIKSSIDSRVDVAFNKPATASSVYGAGYEVGKGNDGNWHTKWVSNEVSQVQWYQVDLGQECMISNVVIHWEDAHALNYTIDISTDGKRYTAILNKSENNYLENEMTFNPIAARYVRVTATMYGSKNQYYSIREFKVFC